MALDLEPYRVGTLPSVYVLQEFVTQAEEERLLAEVRAARAKWISVSGRLLQNHGGIVHRGGLVAAPMASWLEPLLGRLSATGIYGGEAARANHVLINAYQPGEGILPHEDGPLYHPAVAILSLASPAVVRFSRRRAETEETRTAAAGAAAAVASVAVLPRSLLVFSGEAYTDCLHGIDAAAEEAIDVSVANAAECGLQIGSVLSRRGERVSLTVRRVLREFKGISIRL